MFSCLPKDTYIDDLMVSLNDLPKHTGIWKFKKPYRVVARLMDKNCIAGYMIYDRQQKHCMPVDRATLANLVMQRKVVQMKFTSYGVEDRGDLKVECLPYHMVTTKWSVGK